ncbi:membrane bound o-acyl transferase family protein [Sarocladium implicatum]|nr:membrane bound o-acyl transferase family protein [Sarocladium implicatum]
MAILDITAAFQGMVLAVTYLIIFSMTIIFLPKNAIFLRTLSTSALAYITWNFYQQLFVTFPYPVQHSNFACFSLIGMASAAEMILISRVDAEQLLQSSKGGQKPRTNVLRLLWQGVCIFFNLRRVGTMWEVRRLWHRRPQSRLRFLSQKFIELVILYLLVDAITIAPRPDVSLVAESKQTLWRFTDLSADDVAFRFTFTLGYHLMSLISGRFNITVSAFLTVLLGLSEPEAWPHFNGPLAACFTVRGFWGYFWHQMSRKTLTGWAELISDKWLGLKRGTLTSRYTRLLLCFAISGALHHCIDNALRLSHWTLTGETFFTLQAFGILLEDATQAVTRRFNIPKLIRRIMGYIWVLVFLTWTTPAWAYPALRNVDFDMGYLLPFSVLSALKERQGGK